MDIDIKERKKQIKNLTKSVKAVLAKKIEQAVYMFSKEYSISNETPFLFEQIYMTKISELVEQLKKSKKLVKNVLEKKIKPERLPYLTSAVRKDLPASFMACDWLASKAAA